MSPSHALTPLLCCDTSAAPCDTSAARCCALLRVAALCCVRCTAAACDVVTLDSYVGPQPLDEIDKAVWGSMPDPNSGRDATRRPAVPLPWLERPNALVCALVSCVDAPNQLASTDAVMSLKMLTDGADYVARGDRRASYDSLLLNFEDTVEKLRTYVRFAEGELERRSGVSA